MTGTGTREHAEARDRGGTRPIGSGTSILDSLRSHAETHPDKRLFAFLDPNGAITESQTYGSFLERTRDIAAHLVREGRPAPGEPVLLCYPPGVEVICAFFACVRLGLIPVPVYPPSSHGFAEALRKMSFIARDCGAKAVLTERSYFWSFKLHRARARITGLTFDKDTASRLRWIATTDAERSPGEEIPEHHSDVLFLQYTSGSTSEPRGVMVTHRNVVSNCHSVFDHVPIGVSWLPQYHDMGLIGAYLFVAIKGGTTYGISPMDFIRRPLLWLEAIDRFRATASTAPSFAYGYCLRPDKVPDDRVAGLDLGSLRMLLNGAEPVRADVFRGFLRRFEPCGLRPGVFRAAYGLAEHTLAVSAGGTIRSFDAAGIASNVVRIAADDAPPAETSTLVGCGRPLGETRIRIAEVGDVCREAPPGRIGEIWVTGPSKCKGYWGRPTRSAEVFEARTEDDAANEPTWLRTGDLGFLHDGELFVCGRVKDLIIVRGLNYYPHDIEVVVEEDPAIRRGSVAAFSVDEGDREALVVVAELRKVGRIPDSTEINRRIHRRIGIAADRFVYTKRRTVPKTSSGKIARHEARRRWLEHCLEVVAEHVQALATNGTEPPDDRAGDRAAGVAGRMRPSATRARLDRTLRTYGLSGRERIALDEVGLDSLSMAQFAADLEAHLEALGASELVASVDLRWLQRIAVSELSELLDDVESAKPRARLRFRRALAALRREYDEVERGMMRADAELRVDPESRAELPGRAAAVAPARPPEGGILLTGGTGFFGPFLLESLLEQSEDRIYVLVRARDRTHGLERLRSGLSSLHPSPGSGAGSSWSDWSDRVVAIPGDLSQPRLGVSDAEWTFLSESVHTVFHNGALVNYLLDYASMRRTNVEATRDIVRLALGGRPKVLNYVSTTFVFGWSTKDTLFECDQNRDMSLLDFGYSQSKWVSEQIVLGAMEQGLSARVFRPALITPSLEGGGDSYDIAIRLLVFMLKHGMTTTAANQVSFSPADLVANNVVAISRLPSTVGKTFHVTRDDYASMRDVTDVLGRLTNTRFASYDLDEFVPRVIDRCGKDDLLFPLLNFLVRSVDSITAMEFKRYDNRNYRSARARALRAKEDPPLEDVVRGIVRFMRRHRLIEARRAEPVLERI